MVARACRKDVTYRMMRFMIFLAHTQITYYGIAVGGAWEHGQSTPKRAQHLPNTTEKARVRIATEARRSRHTPPAVRRKRLREMKC